jgi:hypothetical protein
MLRAMVMIQHQGGEAMKKAKRKLKAKKQEKVREFLEEVNYHAEQVSIALRHLANAIDNVRSYHLDKEKPS